MGLRSFTMIVSFLMAFGSVSELYGVDGSSGLQTELRRYYKLAMAKVEGKGTLVVEGGQALAIRKEGIVGFGKDESSYADLCPAQFVDGELRPSKSAACTTLASAPRKPFRPSQLVCVTSIEVADVTDSISMSIVGCDASNRVPFNDAYRAKLIFVFPKDSLARSAPSRVEEVIGQVLSAPELPAPAASQAKPEDIGGGRHDTAPPSPQKPTSQSGSGGANAEAPAPATSPDPASPVAPERPPESRIGIGQTPDEVKAILGPPKTTTTRGKKIIFGYPKLKVVFVDGTVSAVEKK